MSGKKNSKFSFLKLLNSNKISVFRDKHHEITYCAARLPPPENSTSFRSDPKSVLHGRFFNV
jgi:hypothetical protein